MTLKIVKSAESALNAGPVTGAMHRLAQNGDHPIGRANAWIALKATGILSSMWFFWACVVLDAAELVLGNPGSWTAVLWVTYLAQTVVQLLALPLLGASQAIISAAQDSKAEADHAILSAVHEVNMKQLEILDELRKRPQVSVSTSTTGSINPTPILHLQPPERPGD